MLVQEHATGDTQEMTLELSSEVSSGNREDHDSDFQTRLINIRVTLWSLPATILDFSE